MSLLSYAFQHGPVAFAIDAAHEFVRFVITDELFLRPIEFQRARESYDDVRGVRQGGGEMARFAASRQIVLRL